MRLIIYILTFAFFVIFFSCDRLKRKGHNIIDKTQEKVSETKQKISEKKSQLVDEVFPGYDNDKPDTESNKKRFKEHLQIDLAADIKNIYAYGDFLGADYKVLISFNCDTSTINKIINTKNMALSKDNDEGLLFATDFPWWNKEKIAKLRPYKAGREYEYWQYLWYDNTSKTAYYEEFSL